MLDQLDFGECIQTCTSGIPWKSMVYQTSLLGLFGPCTTGVRAWSPSPAVRFVFMNIISRCSLGLEGVQFSGLKVGSH